jgi:hypothetical protein
MTLAAYSSLARDKKAWAKWEGGVEDVRFKLLCDKIQVIPKAKRREAIAINVVGNSIYAGENGSGRNAWVRDLYRRLSQFSHSRGGTSNSDLWQSNGPIYSAEGLKLSYHLYLETYAVILLGAKLTDTRLRVPRAGSILFRNESLAQFLTPAYQPLA